MHAGSGNHGCEAIVNSLCHMIKEKTVLVSYCGSEDEKYSLKNLCRIVNERRFEEHLLAHVLYYVYRKLTKDETSFIRYRYQGIFRKEMSPVAISIGGDNYCYDSMLHDLRLANKAFVEKGVKTVLLGCSIEPELLDKEEIIEDLTKYHTIIARESITYEALKQKVKGPNIVCYPDPAFTLGKKELPLPEGFAEGNTVGINISPMIQDNETSAGITMENYRELIKDIIASTDMQIALIPHVVWARNDDRKPIHALYEEFQNTGRVVEIQDGSCEELKGYISKCRFFVGARTHATIAAYSTCVPTLVVGYSVKARGIARDLFGTEEGYVLPVQSLKEKDDLKKAFDWVMNHEAEIKQRLHQIMPEYQEKALLTGKEVDRLWEECNQPQKI
ncbi:MAG: polysaccharide pyruvyl transferase family protein [Lachnospiraceae bacterium]|nr:polysaccharide pyruvyl transferase family protein [Lachnospiraceae bacterium]